MFPGDPPVFDFALLAGLTVLFLSMLFMGGVIASSGSSRRQRMVRTFRLTALAMGIAGVCGTAVGAWVVGTRHFGAWKPVRDALREENARISEHFHGRALTDSEVSSVSSELEARGLEFPMAGNREPLKIRLESKSPPYVAVDFGGSRIAEFDPRTMLCLYAE